SRHNKAARSAEEDERNLKLHILPALGRRKIAEVSRQDVAKLHQSLDKTPIQANRVLALLHHVLAMAQAWGERPEGPNPASGITRYPERKVERFLSAEEFQRLGRVLAEAEAAGDNPCVVAALRLLALTGMRKSEVLGLQWSWIDEKARTVRIPISKTGAKTVL